LTDTLSATQLQLVQVAGVGRLFFLRPYSRNGFSQNRRTKKYREIEGAKHSPILTESKASGCTTTIRYDGAGTGAIGDAGVNNVGYRSQDVGPCRGKGSAIGFDLRARDKRTDARQDLDLVRVPVKGLGLPLQPSF
jgi:hypothetical protein